MKVVHVTETLHGGLRTYLQEVLAHQGLAELAPILIAPRDDLLGAVIPSECEIYPYNRTGRNLTSLIRLAATILRVVVSEKPNIVHLHSSFAGVVGRITLAPWLPIAKYRLIYTAHGWSFLATKSVMTTWAVKKTEKVLSLVTAAITAVSCSEMSLAVDAGIARTKLHVIYNPLRPKGLPTAYAPQVGPLRLLFVGRLDHAKGLDILLKALTKAKLASWRLEVVGAPVHDADIAIPSEIASQVVNFGWLSGPALDAAYQRAECVVIPSRWEAFGLVAIEAMQAGRAVLASNVGGLPEIVEDPDTGTLVPPTITGWAEAVDKIDRSALPHRGIAGYNRVVNRFNAERLNRQLVDLYRAIS